MAWTEQCVIAFNADVVHRQEAKQISKKKAIAESAKEGGIPVGTAEKWVYDVKKSAPKMEQKSDVEKTSAKIRSGEMPDDHAKQIGDALADAIIDGKCATRVGTKVKTAINKVTKSTQKPTPKPIDNFKRLNDHMKAAIDGLTLFAEGTMLPETEDEAEYAKAILAKAANFVVQYARLGADIEGMIDTFVRGDTDGSSKEYNQLRKINR